MYILRKRTAKGVHLKQKKMKKFVVFIVKVIEIEKLKQQ